MNADSTSAATPPGGGDYRYWAFLSYSHQDNLETRRDGRTHCIRWAEWLHGELESYHVPAEFRARTVRTGEAMPERFFPVFQDEKELPIHADLGESIRTALEQSRYLIVICSPRSAVSRYVNEEVRYFKMLGRGDSRRILHHCRSHPAPLPRAHSRGSGDRRRE